MYKQIFGNDTATAYLSFFEPIATAEGLDHAKNLFHFREAFTYLNIRNVYPLLTNLMSESGEVASLWHIIQRRPLKTSQHVAFDGDYCIYQSTTRRTSQETLKECSGDEKEQDPPFESLMVEQGFSVL